MSYRMPETRFAEENMFNARVHTQPHAILIVQLRRLGDVLMTTPAIRALREAFPSAKIDFLTERPSQQLLENNPHISRVIAIPSKRSFSQNATLVRELRSQKYDWVIDFNGLPSSAILSWLTGANTRLGINHRGRGLLYSHRIPFPNAKYSAQNKLEMLRALDVASPNIALEFFVSQSDSKWASTVLNSLHISDSDFLVTISPVSRQPYKVWPAQNFAIVADHLVEKFGAKILFVFGPGEEFFVEDVKKHMKTSALPTNYPMPSLAQTKALFERAKLHIGNDNGPAHFAISANIPVITIFGEPRAENWSPTNNQKVVALEHDPGCKSNCVYPRCQLECLTSTSPQIVCSAADKLIAQEKLAK